MRPTNPRRRFAVIATMVIASLATNARAEDPKRVEWSPDWPRVRLVEALDVVAFTVGSFEIDKQWQPRQNAGWRGGILFDDAIRNALRGRTYAAQATAADVAEIFYKGGTIAPYIVDVYFVALGVHQNADVALQMLLINLQSLGLSGVMTLVAERGVGRARPFTSECGPDGKVRNASGEVLFDKCDGVADNQSFYSGHAAATATMAGLTCVHHQHIPLYGGGVADLAPCLFMIGVSVTTGIGRIVTDRHWSSDVMLGWGVGAFSGYVLPSILHYGFGHGKPLGEIRTKNGGRMLPVPQLYPSGGGLGMVGSF